jgi:hypothetical protein
MIVSFVGVAYRLGSAHILLKEKRMARRNYYAICTLFDPAAFLKSSAEVAQIKANAALR